jgi:hypothetical protein
MKKRKKGEGLLEAWGKTKEKKPFNFFLFLFFLLPIESSLHCSERMDIQKENSFKVCVCADNNT